MCCGPRGGGGGVDVTVHTGTKDKMAGKFGSHPLPAVPNSMLECVLTLWIPKALHCTQYKCLALPKLGARGGIYLYFYRVITGGIRRVLYDFPSVHCIHFRRLYF